MSYQTSITCYSPRSDTGKCISTIPEASGGCRHNKAESMSRAEFGRLPVIRCHTCKHALGRKCPECRRWY